MNQEIITKKCSKCQEIKPINDFHKNGKISKNGVIATRPKCKLCESNIRHFEYLQNPEKFKNRNKIFRSNHKNYYSKYNKNYRQKHKQEIIVYQINWRINNKEKIKQTNKINHLKNKERDNNLSKIYHKTHKKEISETRKIRENKRLKTDNCFRLIRLLRRRVLLALHDNWKFGSTIELLGCSIIEFKKYLEKQFTEGMNWGNQGKGGWDIDHIIPCNWFKQHDMLTNLADQKRCFHYTNCRPMWHKDNLKKSDNVVDMKLLYNDL